MTLDQLLQIAGIMVATALAIVIYMLQSRLSDKQKIENRLEVEKAVGKKLAQMQDGKSNYKIQLYNSKLIGKKYFSENKRSWLWGYPYHGAELHALNFDGIEVVCGLEKWHGKKFAKIGLIPYERVLNVLPDGDSSFNGAIFYVKPKLIQLDKYSIAYATFRYYPVDKRVYNDIAKPTAIKLRDVIKGLYLKTRYNLWLKWRMKAKETRYS